MNSGWIIKQPNWDRPKKVDSRRVSQRMPSSVRWSGSSNPQSLQRSISLLNVSDKTVSLYYYIVCIQVCTLKYTPRYKCRKMHQCSGKCVFVSCWRKRRIRLLRTEIPLFFLGTSATTRMMIPLYMAGLCTHRCPRNYAPLSGACSLLSFTNFCCQIS